MEAEERFIFIAALICEPARAIMLWNLLDGRAYTATELAMAADISPTSASNHLSKLLAADIVKVESQGRHRYFSFSRPEVAYVVESLANLTEHDSKNILKKDNEVKGVKFCRTCYDHLAGFVGVTITEALEKKRLIKRSETNYIVTNNGWIWFSDFGITKNEMATKRRLMARQCLDWSERKPHLAGQLGALLLEKMLQKQWFKKVKFSRELWLTTKGRMALHDLLGVSV
jgi:DNA-binding transcriptional ArsR family regulator